MKKNGIDALSGLLIGSMLGILLVSGCSKSNQSPNAEQAKNQPPAVEQTTNQPPSAEQPKNPLITAEQIKSDLLHKTIPLGGNKLETFDKLENFKEVKILQETKQGDTVEYKVKIDYNDTTYGTVDKIEATIIYKQIDGKWKMASASGKLIM